ncbi:TetR/AcrR family transcriptional regulator [Shewanella youngdeokensis]|uniref:TetR/AcrR family transcriptional regulator n=1 Tax=Shewanella youngdeokensis TaxID=2999068 RepID=A0ABZ0JVY0_9GAMM|nr:TetR/AcrR family transcriptional regulator [Shewanella sp. DAU334]
MPIYMHDEIDDFFMNNYLLNPSSVVETILNEAKIVIKEQGFCSFKISTIIERCRCSTKTLYNVFSSKEDIVVALFIQHVNDIIVKINMISDDESLSHQEKIIYSMMYDPMKCWAAEEEDFCINFLGVNPYIYNFVSPEFVGNLQVIFLEIKEHTQNMWKKAVEDACLHSNPEDILKCIAQLRGIQKGAVAIGQNKFLRQFGYDNNIEPTFDSMCGLVTALDWQTPCTALCYSNMIKVLTPLLEVKCMNLEHYGLPMESLKDKIEL